jgi:hypothetical protein
MTKEKYVFHDKEFLCQKHKLSNNYVFDWQKNKETRTQSSAWNLKITACM